MTNELAEKVAKAIYGEGPGIPSWDTLKVIAVMREATRKETIQ